MGNKYLTAAKNALGITVNDPEIDAALQDLVNAARADLRAGGIEAPTAAAPKGNAALYKRGVVLYVTAGFVDDATAARRAGDDYDRLKTSLALNGEFRGASGP